MNNIVFFLNVSSHYRKSFWLKLLASEKFNSRFFFGDSGSTGIKTIDFNHDGFTKYSNQIFKVKNFWIYSRILIWQNGVIKRCILDPIDVAIFTGEMNCLSTWIASMICRMRNIQVVFWGHGLYGNESKLKLFFRKTFYRLANRHLLYERRAKKLMIKQGFISCHLFVIFNSLDYYTHFKLRYNLLNKGVVNPFSFFENPSFPVIVFIGRLTFSKKLDLLIKSMMILFHQLLNINLIIIGDGPERLKLQKLGKNLVNRGRLHFTGSCYDEELIARYLFNSDLCVSPGNVGLTAIHCLSFGTPVATHSNMENQGPEAEAIIDSYNGFFFKEDDVFDLTYKIKNWLENNRNRKELRERCFKVVDSFYNPSYQMSVFNRLVKGENPEI